MFLDIKHSHTLMEHCSFFCMCNINWHIVHDYSRVAAPLNQALRKEQPEHKPSFTNYQAQAFRTLVEAVISPPIVLLPQRHHPYLVDTTACDHQLGTALFQTHPDKNESCLESHHGLYSRRKEATPCQRKNAGH